MSISAVYVYPSIKSMSNSVMTNTGGLCGRWFDGPAPKCGLFYKLRDLNTNVEYDTCVNSAGEAQSSFNFINYWRYFSLSIELLTFK